MREMRRSWKYINSILTELQGNCKIILKDVLFVPSMMGNFISVGKAIKNGVRVAFNDIAQ